VVGVPGCRAVLCFLWGANWIYICYVEGSHCPDSRLTVNCEIQATCSSTYSPARTSQEAHSVSIK
jgi:hypothetical protein